LGYDIEQIRHDFPILEEQVYGKQLVYLDNAATTQKPRAVIDRISQYYRHENCNIHRGVHYLSQKATEAFEQVRRNVQKHLNAAYPYEIIFTKGTTEAINLVSCSYARTHIEEGDEILIGGMEHHSNIVPWQLIAEQVGAEIKEIPFDEEGELAVNELKNLINDKTRIIAVTHVSNVLGTVNPVKRICEIAHQHDVPVLVDGAQAIPHMEVDVQDLDCDFYCFSGHKVYGPMGVGVLYGKESLLDEMEPYQGGGEMVDQVTFDGTSYNDLPYKFEAGTPNVVGVLAMDSALKYIKELGIKNIQLYENELLDYATIELLKIENLRIIGNANYKASVISFIIDGIHPYDIGAIIDKMGIAVRTGHHCAQPVIDFYEIPGTIRASFALYNTKAEIDLLVQSIVKAQRMLS